MKKKTFRITVSKLKFLIPLFIFCEIVFSGSVYCQAQETGSDPEEPKPPSAENREQKTYSLAIEPLGFAPWPGAGASASYFLNSETILESNLFASGLFLKTKATMATIQAKFFFEDSEYVNFGFAWRRDTSGDVLPSDHSKVERKSISSVGLNAAFGNQWQFENSFLRVDWLGFYFPVYSFSRNFISEGTKSEEAMRRNALFQKEKASPSVQYLRFSIGYSI